MAQQYTIPDIINFAKIAQVNSQVDISQNNVFRGGTLDEQYSRKLYMVRKAVEFVYNTNPNYPTLRQVAEYLYALVRPFLTTTATISITNPSGASVNVGDNATFSVSVLVSNGAPYTVQWFRDGVAIPGATGLSYTLINAQTTDNGATFFAVATAPGVGQAVSTTATITVTAVITGFFTYDPTVDFYPILLTNSDPFTYISSFAITHNANISIPLPGAMPANQYMLAKIPIGEPIKANWFNTPLNNGTVPDAVWQSVVQFGGFTYYATRVQASMDVTQPLIFS